MMVPKAQRELDLRGKICPYPVIYTLREIKEMKDGDVLKVVIDHLPSVENIPIAVEKGRHEVLEVSKIGATEYKILIRVRK